MSRSGKDKVVSQAPGLNPQAPPFVAGNPQGSLTLLVGSNKTVLLQTARATVYNPETPLITQTARVILDPGNQRSYTTDCLKEKLSIVTAEHQCMTILTFGSEL